MALTKQIRRIINKLTKISPQIDLQSTKNPQKIMPKPLRNPYQKPPKQANLCQTDFYCEFFHFWQFFGGVLGAIWLQKGHKNSVEIKSKKRSFFEIEFWAILKRLVRQNGSPKRTFVSSFLKTPILQKSRSRAGGSAIIRVRSLPKTIKNQ